MLQRSSHSVWECQYHLVWTTWRRRKALKEKHEREYCAEWLRRIADEYGMQIEELEVDTDHVHIYLRIPPQMAVGQAVKTLKSISAQKLLRRYEYLKGIFWTQRVWSASYFVRTVGEGVTAKMVKNYIREHEAKSSLGSVQTKLFKA
jgi:putative transposase